MESFFKSYSDAVSVERTVQCFPNFTLFSNLSQLFNSFSSSFQVFSSGVENAEEVVVKVMATVFDRILVQFVVGINPRFSLSFYIIY